MRKYFVYLDDGKSVFRVAVPAKNEKDARRYVDGNGEVVAINDVTKDYPISAQKVADALIFAGFGATERDFIVRALTISGIADID
jgi:hypothetical protein